MIKAGDKFGSYKLESLLGIGGFAEVWLGNHEFMNNEAAIKVLHMALSTPEERDRFLDEARHLAGFSHPNIVRVMECGIENDIPFLVLEYAPNGTLRTRHPKGTRLPANVIVDYVRQIAEGLQYAHNRRLIHRDVKPENMLLGKNNHVLVSDFGIAAIEKTSSFRKTQQQQQDAVGTIGYMAPEQCDGNPSTTSDQYALGVVVYEWLCGMLPFKGNAVEIRTQQKMKLPQLRDKVPGISPTLEQVVLKALSEDLHERFRDMEAFADALEQAVNNPNAPIIQAQNVNNLNPPIIQAQVNPINLNDPPGFAVPNVPWPPGPVGGANNANAVESPFVANNANANTANMGASPFMVNNANVNNANINNANVGASPFVANNANAGATPFGANNSYPFYSAPTVNAQPGASPFSSFDPSKAQTNIPRRRTKLFDWRNVLGAKNRFFVFGGGFIDFLMAVALGVWLNDGVVSWNLWLVSLLSAWIVRAICVGVGRRYMAIPLALALAFYWFLGSWAFWTVLNDSSHINLIPPHIVAILVLFVSTPIHVLYANKKK